MPPHLLADANTLCENTNSIPHQRLVPIGFSASAVWAGEDPVVRGLVLRVSSPSAQGFREKRIEWNWLLRCLGLARPDNLQDDGARHADLVLDEIDIRPFESEQFACPESSNNIEQDHGSLSDIEGAEQRLDFCDFEYRRDLRPFGTLPYPLDRVAIKQFVPQAVVEEDAHHVADFA